MTRTTRPDDSHGSITVEEPRGFTQLPDSLLLNADLSDGAVRLYAVLKHHARSKSKAYPGRRLLATELGVKSLRTVDARIVELIAAGYLSIEARYHARGGRTSNVYHLAFYPHGGERATLEPAGAPPGKPVGASDGAATLHRARAPRCATRVQPSAHQVSTSSEDTPPPNQHRSRPSDEDGHEHQHVRGAGEDLLRNKPQPGRFATEVLGLLPEQLAPRTLTQAAELSKLLGPLGETWEAPALVHALTTSRPLPPSVTHPAGLIRSRIAELAPRSRRPQQPQWCGECEQTTRMIDSGGDTVSRCHRCHPARVPAAPLAGVTSC